MTLNASDILLLVILLALSAYFSSSETAFSTVNKIRLKSYADSGSEKAKTALDIAEDYDRTLATILVGNNAVNTASAALMTTVASALFGASGAVIATFVTTVLLLIFGEILPKTYGKAKNERVALGSAKFMRILIVGLTPVVSVFQLIQKAMLKVWDKGDEAPTVTEDELKYILDTIEEEGVIQEDEAQLVQSALDFNDVPVQKILTPRVDVVALDVDDSIDEIRRVVMEERFTRIPVYEGTIDNIIGILQSRDFLEALLAGGKIDLRQMLAEPLFVHKTKTASSMLADFKRRRAHIAVVTDDYGGTMGIVTMEDLLEEIVGDIWDEDEEVEQDLTALPDGSSEVSGDMDIDDLFEAFHYHDSDFTSESSTVGGWTMEMLEHLPAPGESFFYDGFTVTVLEVDEQRVTRLRVTYDPGRSQHHEPERS